MILSISNRIRKSGDIGPDSILESLNLVRLKIYYPFHYGMVGRDRIISKEKFPFRNVPYFFKTRLVMRPKQNHYHYVINRYLA